MVEELARRRQWRLDRELCACRAGGDDETLVAQPQTYMNRSGFAVRCLIERSALPLSALLVIFDDVALPLGRLRLRESGGPGGHRGLESIVEQLQSTQVPRLRLGIGTPTEPAGIDLADWVLGPFDATEQPRAGAVVAAAAEAAEAWLREPLPLVASRVNAWRGAWLDEGAVEVGK